MKDKVYMEVHETVSPYAKMMEALKKYIDQHDTITYCDALPDEGEEDHLYIIRTGEAYIWEDEWIQLTGSGTDGITGINVNGTPQEVIDHVVDLLIKTSDLENDSGYITDAALDGYAKTEDIPTELSDLKNDMGYITEDALDGYALEDEIPTKVSELENDADYTTVEATKSEIAEQIAEIVAGAPESLDTLKEIADWIEHHEDDAAAMNTAIKEAQETADNALTEAETVKETADKALNYAEDASSTANSAESRARTAESTANTALTTAEGVKESLEDYATKEEVEAAQDAADDAMEKAQAVEDAAITGINVNGTPAEITDHIADIEVSGGGGYSITYDEPEEALVFAAGAGITYDEPTETLIF